MDKKLHYKIWNTIRDFRIFEAIELLKEQLKTLPVPSIVDNLNNIESTYRYMINYMIAGSPDSSRSTILNEVINKLHYINDSLLRESSSPVAPDIYYSILRNVRFSNYNLERLLNNYFDATATLELANISEKYSDELSKKKEDALEDLFNYTFTLYENGEEINRLVDTVNAHEADYELQAQIVSALTLGLNFFYSGKALNALIDIYEKNINNKISARALTGIVLTVNTYPYRISIDKKIMDRLSLWKDSIIVYSQLKEVVKNIIFTRDTDRVADKMRNEVIPEIMKLKPGLMQKLKESNMDIESMTADNPEWEEILDKNGISVKLREINDLQMEGVDVMMTAFSQLKYFPFFNRINNWFLPFDSNNSGINITDDKHRKSLDSLLSVEGLICDSDKYSLAIAISKMPPEQTDMMLNQINANASQLAEAVKEMKDKSSMPEFDIELIKYLRDLFRFFRLFRDRKFFKDPFSKPFDFFDLPVIGEMMNESEILHIVSEFYFKRGFYKDALEILTHLENEDSANSYYWEKRGYCLHSLKEYELALDAYKKAELVKEPSGWLLEKLAVLNRRLGYYAEAEGYYKKLLTTDNDNIKYLFSLGDILLNLDKIDEALQNFYHAEYLSPENKKIKRAVAWAELIKGNFDKSTNYFDKLIVDSKEPSDYMNSGHLSLLADDYHSAEDKYLKAASLYNVKSKSEFRELFYNDLDILKKFGVADSTISLLLDDITNKLDK